MNGQFDSSLETHTLTIYVWNIYHVVFVLLFPSIHNSSKKTTTTTYIWPWHNLIYSFQMDKNRSQFFPKHSLFLFTFYTHILQKCSYLLYLCGLCVFVIVLHIVRFCLFSHRIFFAQRERA